MQARGKALREKFEQTPYDELRLSLLVESQRVLAWMAPATAPPSPVSAGSKAAPPANESAATSPPQSSATAQPIGLQLGTAAPSAVIDAAFVPGNDFIENHCASCHDDAEKKGNLDLTALGWKPHDPTNRATWIKVHDRLAAGEMPPKKKPRPDPAALATYLQSLTGTLVTSERAAIARDGRSLQRRLNAYEYENALRDLFHAPWLQIKASLPDDGVANRFNKSGRALDVSHVQLSRCMPLADTAIREAISVQAARPPTTTRRFYARDAVRKRGAGSATRAQSRAAARDLRPAQGCGALEWAA